MSEKEDKMNNTSKPVKKQGEPAKYFCPTVGDGKVVTANSVKEASNKVKEK